MGVLIELYKNILDYAGLSVDGDGHVLIQHDKDRSPVTIDGKELVLPTPEILKRPHHGEQVIFHPLAENTLRKKESEVILKLKSALNVRMNYLFGILASQLLGLCLNKELHGKFTPSQSELLVLLKDVDETSRVNFTKLMVKLLGNDYEKVFLNVFLHKGGTVRGQRYARAGIMSFPFYRMLKDKGTEIEGIKIRNKDVEIYSKIYKFIFPLIDEPEAYNYGSNSDIAPYTDALLMTTAKALGRFNDIVDEFGDFIADSDILVSNSDWVEPMMDLNSLLMEIRRIPPQFGNEGSNAPEPVSVSGSSIDRVPPPPMIDNRPPAYPQQTGRLAPASGTGLIPPSSIDWNSRTQPLYPQAPQVPAADNNKLRYTERGLDFMSVMETTPAVAYAPDPFQIQNANPWSQQGPMGGGMPQQQEPLPRWAAPQTGFGGGMNGGMGGGMNNGGFMGRGMPDANVDIRQPAWQAPNMYRR
jgi:hypothetical protein